MAQTNGELKYLRAILREKKKRPKMAVHGRGMKMLPMRGVPKRRRAKM